MALTKRYYLLAISLLCMDLFLCTSVFEWEYNLPKFIKYVFSLSALFTLLYVCLSNRVKLLVVLKESYGLNLFILWSLCLLALSPFESLLYVQKVFGARYYFLPFLVPVLIMLVDLNIKYYLAILKLTRKLLALLLICQLYLIIKGLSPDAWYFDMHIMTTLQLGATLLLFVSHMYKSLLLSNAIMTSYLLSLFIYASWGRRGITIELAITLLVFLSIKLFNERISFHVKKLNISLLCILMLAATVYYLTYASDLYLFQRGINYSAVMDTRDRVWTDFFADFTTAQDWIFGRGLNGTILRTISLDQFGETIETGYLFCLLKGGLLYVLLMIIIFLRAIYLGLFRSKNDLSKAFAIIILIQLYNMSAFGLPDFSSKYTIVWLCVSGCYSYKLRNIDNDELAHMLSQRG